MIVNTLLLWLLGALFGSMLFFAVTVAPTVFRVLPADQGGAFLRRFFPQYYLWGIVMALLCTLAAVANKNGLVISGSCTLILALFIYARQILMPRINRARDRSHSGDAAAAKQFKRLHLQSVIINATQLILLLCVTLATAWV